MVGDLTNPANITFERAQVLWALNISHYTTKAITRAESMSPVDERYVGSAFGYVADNLVQMGNLSSKDSETLRQMQRNLEQLTSEVHGHLKGDLPSSLRVFLPR